MQRTNTAVWHEKYQRWQINVQKDGERRSFYSGTPGRKGQREANAKADAWLDDNVADDHQRIKDLWELFIASKEETTGKANVKKLKESWRLYVEPAIGNKQIRRVTENDLQSIIDKAFANRHLSRKSLANIAGCIKAFYKYCRRRLKVTALEPELEIPAAATSKPKTILQPDDLKTLFAVDTRLRYGKRVPDPLIHAYRLQVLTGLRPGELLGLRYGDVRGNDLRISRSINYDGDQTRGKNDNAVRQFTLSPRAKAELDAHIASLPQPIQRDTRLFDISRQHDYYKAWVRYRDDNGISPVSLYELRHTFVSVVKYLPAGEVKPLVGHSEAMDTFGTYGHILDGDSEIIAADVEALFERILAKEA